jgi:hypothetical protein
MTVTVSVTIPEEVLRAPNGETSRRILEQFALEGYKSGQLSHADVGRLLGFETPVEVDGFLKEHGVYNVDYTDEELAREEETSGYIAGLRASAK